MPLIKPNTHQVPNEICDQHMKDLSGSEFKVLYLIARKTCGFHKDVEAMGTEKICAYTGLSAESVRQAVKVLDSQGLIERSKQFDTEANTYRDTLYSLAVQDDAPLPQKLGEGSPKNLPTPPLKIGGPLPQKLGGNTLKETILKETGEITPISSDPCTTLNPTGKIAGGPLPCTTLDTERETVYEELEEPGRADPKTRRAAQSREIRRSRQERDKADRKEAKRQDHLRMAEDSNRLREAARSRLDAPGASRGGYADAPRPVSAPPAASQPDPVALWNAAFPNLAVDPAIYANGSRPWPLRDGSLAGQMDKILEKVRWLLAGGAEVTFSHLIRKESNGAYGWSTILAGGLDWAAKQKTSKSQKQNDFVERKLRELREPRAQRSDGPREAHPGTTT